MKPLAVFALVGLVVLTAALYLSTWDGVVGPGQEPGLWLLDRVLSALLGIVLTAVVTGLVTWGVAFLRSQWRRNGRWLGGPNAYWRRKAAPRNERSLSTDDLLKLYLVQQMGLRMPSRDDEESEDSVVF